MSKVCFEHDFSKVASVEAYEHGVLDFRSPVFVSDASALYDDIVKGEIPVLLPFSDGSMKCTDTMSRKVSGIQHDVRIEFETQIITEADYDLLFHLSTHAHEFIFNFFGGVRKAVRTDDIPYSFTFNDDNGTVKCSISLVNGQGLTLLDRKRQ